MKNTLLFLFLISLTFCSCINSNINLFKIANGGKMGFIDSTGNTVIDCKFDFVGDFHNGLAIAIVDSFYGYINTKGEFEIDRKFNIMRHIESEFDEFSISSIINQKRKHEFLSHLKNKPDTIFNYKIPDILNFSEGMVVFHHDGKYGYLNTKGDTIINSEYKFAKQFKQGLAAVKIKVDSTSHKFGYINSKNSFVIKPEYSVAYNFSEGKAIVGVFHMNKVNHASRQYTTVGLKHFVLNERGDILLNVDFDKMGSFQNGYAQTYSYRLEILTGAGYNYIDSTGKEYLSDVGFKSNRGVFYLDSSSNLGGQIFLVQDQKEKWGFLPKDLNSYDKTYEDIFKYEDANIFSENLASVKLNGKWGFINSLEEYIIEPIYTKAENFKNGLAYVEQEENGFKLTGYINKKGVIIWSQKKAKVYF